MSGKTAKQNSNDITRVYPNYKAGLNDSQVHERMANGYHNAPVQTQTRSYGRIISDNIVTLFNIINVVIAMFIIMVGSHKNLLFMGVVISNTAIGIFHEIRAKKNVDRLSIISQTKVKAVRNSEIKELNQEEIVLDDIMIIETGNQICSDGEVVFCEGLEVDESQLTGESIPVKKEIADEVLSGSFVVAGSAYIRVNAVGEQSYISSLSKKAKREKKPTSELMRLLNSIIKTLTIIIVPLGLALFTTQYLRGIAFEEAVLGTAASMIGMIPEGLMLLTSISFAIGAINLSRKNVLSQNMPCIETLARVDTLCLDKTGTITDGSLTVADFVVYGHKDKQYFENAVAAIIHSLSDNNSTAKALRKKYDKDPEWKAVQKSPFSSERKWSGCSFENEGSFKIGAPEFIANNVSDEINTLIEKYSSEGYRILALTHSQISLSLTENSDDEVVAIILISDNIRPEAPSTFEFFRLQEVEIKVISGDNPKTVSSIARRAGIVGAQNYVDMSSIDDDISQYNRLAKENIVFGRVSPYQKKNLINALQENGHVVAMTGDGVNDVLALKDADCSVAMSEGSDAARHISDFVLLTSNFDSMIGVVREGRRVVNNIERVASLFLVKTIYSVILTALFIFLDFQYPLRPIQLSPVSALTIGIPSFFLALKPSYERIQGRFMHSVIHISLPGAICIIINFILIQIFGELMNMTYEQTSTISVLIAGIIGFIVLKRVAEPLDLKNKIMIVLLFLGFILLFLFFGEIFELTPLFSDIALLYLPLLVLVLPMFKVVSFICIKVYKAKSV